VKTKLGHSDPFDDFVMAFKLSELTSTGYFGHVVHTGAYEHYQALEDIILDIILSNSGGDHGLRALIKFRIQLNNPHYETILSLLTMVHKEYYIQYYISQIYYKQHDYSNALIAIESAISLYSEKVENDSLIFTYKEMGILKAKCLYGLEDYSAAFELFSLIAQNPSTTIPDNPADNLYDPHIVFTRQTDYDVLVYIAKLQIVTGEHEDALVYLKSFIDHYVSMSNLLNQIGTDITSHKALDYINLPMVYFVRAVIYIKQGHTDSALADLNTYYELQAYGYPLMTN
jgi:tetratricopeptide (TPR) repeat protein